MVSSKQLRQSLRSWHRIPPSFLLPKDNEIQTEIRLERQRKRKINDTIMVKVIFSVYLQVIFKSTRDAMTNNL